MREWLELLWILIAIFFISCFLLATDANAQDRATIKQAIVAIALEEGVDPTLALAIAKVESGFNPKAVGAIGELGLFQLRPEFHAVEPGRINHNARIAMRYLRHVKALCKPDYGDAWFVCFNTGPNKRVKVPYEFPYYKKVQNAKREVAPHVAAK